MNGICPMLGCHYGAIPADDCNSSWIAVKVDRAGNQVILDEGFTTEEAAEQFARAIHRQDLADRTAPVEFTWRDKPINDLTRDELIELVGVLYGLVETSTENFERVAAFNNAVTQANGGRA